MMLQPDKIVRLSPEQIAETIARQQWEKKRAEALRAAMEQGAQKVDTTQPHPLYPIYREI